MHNEEPASSFCDPMKGKTPKHGETDTEVATPCDQEDMSINAKVHEDRKPRTDSFQILSIDKIYGDPALWNETFQRLSPIYDTLSGDEKSCENMSQTKGNGEIGNTSAELIVYSRKDDLKEKTSNRKTRKPYYIKKNVRKRKKSVI